MSATDDDRDVPWRRVRLLGRLRSVLRLPVGGLLLGAALLTDAGVSVGLDGERSGKRPRQEDGKWWAAADLMVAYCSGDPRERQVELSRPLIGRLVAAFPSLLAVEGVLTVSDDHACWQPRSSASEGGAQGFLFRREDVGQVHATRVGRRALGMTMVSPGARLVMYLRDARGFPAHQVASWGAERP